jgi:glycosyltransferase involved in cell wall biosynthesis
MRGCAVSILPSFYEGLPLVLVEAAACGCRLVATDLEPVRGVLAPALGEGLIQVEAPRLSSEGAPRGEDLAAFVDALVAGLREALRRGPLELKPDALAIFTWTAVFERVQALWRAAIDRR